MNCSHCKQENRIRALELTVESLRNDIDLLFTNKMNEREILIMPRIGYKLITPKIGMKPQYHEKRDCESE